MVSGVIEIIKVVNLELSSRREHSRKNLEKGWKEENGRLRDCPNTCDVLFPCSFFLLWFYRFSEMEKSIGAPVRPLWRCLSVCSLRNSIGLEVVHEHLEIATDYGTSSCFEREWQTKKSNPVFPGSIQAYDISRYLIFTSANALCSSGRNPGPPMKSTCSATVCVQQHSITALTIHLHQVRLQAPNGDAEGGCNWSPPGNSMMRCSSFQPLTT